MSKFPPSLIIKANRFLQDDDGNVTKISNKISCKAKLTSKDLSVCCTTEAPEEYYFTAIVIHEG